MCLYDETDPVKAAKQSSTEEEVYLFMIQNDVVCCASWKSFCFDLRDLGSAVRSRLFTCKRHTINNTSN